MITVNYESTTMYTLFAFGYTITRILTDGRCVMAKDKGISPKDELGAAHA